MDIEEVKTLTALMIENDLMEIRITDGEKRIVLRRGAAPVQTYVAPPVAAPVAMVAPTPATVAAEQKPAAPSKDDGKAAIKSPMVGTFYAAADPDSPPFVQVGDQINPETVVCIIEAMKVFNEIKAEVAGIVEAIQVTNGQPVEFGQTIMTVRPA